MKYWFLACLLSFPAWAGFVPCGEHALELTHPTLVWRQFAVIQVRSKLADLDGVICVGKVSGSTVAEQVTYRDEANRTQVARTVEELRAFQVLITSQDLPPGIGGVVRSGDLVSLRIGEPEQHPELNRTIYPLAVRFHRALARGSANDIRELQFFGSVDYQEDSVSAQRTEKNFDILKLFIGAIPPRMEQIVLKQGDTMIESFFTSSLTRVGDLH